MNLSEIEKAPAMNGSLFALDSWAINGEMLGFKSQSRHFTSLPVFQQPSSGSPGPHNQTTSGTVVTRKGCNWGSNSAHPGTRWLEGAWGTCSVHESLACSQPTVIGLRGLKGESRRCGIAEGGACDPAIKRRGTSVFRLKPLVGKRTWGNGTMNDKLPGAKVGPRPDHGNMSRDQRDEWPSDEPAGSFDITLSPNGIEGYPGASAHMLFVCPNGKRCGVLLGPSPVGREHPDAACIWGWDGNIERPTLTPSINCLAEKDGKPTSGCGWHGFITNGVMR